MCKVIWSTENGALVRMAGGGKCQKQCPEKSHWSGEGVEEGLRVNWRVLEGE